jgi:hypothetical protein
MLKKDNMLLGLILGALLPIITYYLLRFGLSLADQSGVLRPETEYVISLVGVVPAFRYYMVSLKADRTGRGMLLVMFVYAIAYVVNYL